MFKGRKKAGVFEPNYSDEDLEKRKRDIPTLNKPGVEVVKDAEDTTLIFENEDVINFEKDLKPIPASIEYLATRYKRNKQLEGIEEEKPVDEGELLDSRSASTLQASVDSIVQKSHVLTDEQLKSQKNADNYVTPDEEDKTIFDFAKVPLATEARMKDLEVRHMEFYGILSKIQETHTSTDFKSAYDIQDRISYLLNHKTLLYKALVEDLIKYLDSIIEKLNAYFVNLSAKQAQFKLHNKKISELKNYKWKTDESMKIIKENQSLAEEEIRKSKNHAPV